MALNTTLPFKRRLLRSRGPAVREQDILDARQYTFDEEWLSKAVETPPQSPMPSPTSPGVPPDSPAQEIKERDTGGGGMTN